MTPPTIIHAIAPKQMTETVTSPARRKASGSAPNSRKDAAYVSTRVRQTDTPTPLAVRSNTSRRVIIETDMVSPFHWRHFRHSRTAEALIVSLAKLREHSKTTYSGLRG